jgi:cholesterol transport system auxiliary component
MTHPRVPLLVTFLLFGTAALGGCALLTKNDPLTARYFSPEPSGSGALVEKPVVADAGAAARVAEPELRLGRITSASYLGERIVFRNSPYELGFYDDLRWTEKPETYLRRALSRALFEDGAVRRVVSGASPTLEVELVEFAELKTPAHVGRVRAAYVLYDSRAVLAESTIAVDVPIPAVKDGSQQTEIVEGLANGLDSVVKRIVEDVTSRLVARKDDAR